jgi:hypothetical protein
MLRSDGPGGGPDGHAPRYHRHGAEKTAKGWNGAGSWSAFIGISLAFCFIVLSDTEAIPLRLEML